MIQFTDVTTNVARQFLLLVDKHLPKQHRQHKLFNRNNVKCSYSFMNNMASITNSHNAKVLAPAPEQTLRTYKCRHPQNCPLNGHCLTECVVYKASVAASNKPTRHFCGLAEGPFKTRYNSFPANRDIFFTKSSRNFIRIPDENNASKCPSLTLKFIIRIACPWCLTC